jgi:hypothetical protein
MPDEVSATSEVFSSLPRSRRKNISVMYIREAPDNYAPSAFKVADDTVAIQRQFTEWPSLR